MTRPTLRLNLVSDPAAIAKARKAVEAFAAVLGLPVQSVSDIGLCVNEALANVIRHAYHGQADRPIELDVLWDEPDLTMTLRDWGGGHAPDLSKVQTDADPAEAALRPGGLGLPCLKRLLDHVAFEPQPDGMLLRMVKRKR